MLAEEISHQKRRIQGNVSMQVENGCKRATRITPKGSGEVEFDLVDVAPAPGFAGFERFHDGVFGFMEMLGGVLVFGGVAAADVAAFQAEAQVDPSVAHLEAFLATVRMRFYGANQTEMRTSNHSISSLT
jgi:hypothetical protein